MKNIILFVIILFVVNSACYSQLSYNTFKINYTSSNIFSDTLIKKDKLKEPKLKEPFVSGMLSFLVPGAGQFHNDEPVNGAIRLGIAVTCITAFALSPPFRINVVDSETEYQKSQPNGNAIKIVALLGYTVNWIMAIVDASYSASKYNKRILKEWNSKKVNVGFNFTKSAFFNFSYYF